MTTQTISQTIQAHYEKYGWRRRESGDFEDFLLLIDNRPLMMPYYERSYRRLDHYFETNGNYFLDAGSGGNPAQEYSGQFEKHVCVDFALAGLLESKQKLGNKGLCVVADLAHLPFKDNSFAGGISANSLYHLPPDRQTLALAEYHRTMQSHATFVIIYISGYVLGLGKIGRNLWRKLTGYQPPLAIQQNPDISTPPCWAMLPGWFSQQLGPQTEVELTTYRLLHRHISSRFIPNSSLGEQILAGLTWLEATFPKLLMPFGYYVTVAFRKK